MSDGHKSVFIIIFLLRQIKAAHKYNEHKQLKYKTSIQM